LLRLVKNPTTFEGSSYKPSGIGKGGKSLAQPIKMVFTIHIRYKHDSDTSISDEKWLSSADIEGELLNSHPSDYLIEQQPSASETAELISLSAPVSVVTQPQRRKKQKHRKSRAVAISNSSDSDIQVKPFSYANQPSFFSVVSPPSGIFSTMKPPPPTTPPSTQPEAIKPPSACSSTLVPKSGLVRKRSLTLMSPDKITTRNPRSTKKHHDIKSSLLTYSQSDSKAENSSSSTNLDSPLE